MEDEKSLKSDAVLGQLADSLQDEVNDLFTDRVVTASVVVGRVLFAVNHLLRVKQTTIWTRPYLICNVHNRPNYILVALKRNSMTSAISRPIQYFIKFF